VHGDGSPATAMLGLPGLPTDTRFGSSNDASTRDAICSNRTSEVPSGPADEASATSSSQPRGHLLIQYAAHTPES